MKIKRVLRDFIGMVLFIGSIILFSKSIIKNYIPLGIAFLFFVADYLFIGIHEARYKKNFP